MSWGMQPSSLQLTFLPRAKDSSVGSLTWMSSRHSVCRPSCWFATILR